MKYFIRELTREDWPAVREIYREGIETGDATFETSTPEWGQWTNSHHPFARLVAVARTEGLVKGWAALSPVSSRLVYAGVAEVSVYVAEGARGEGVGRMLLTELIARSEQNGIWTLQASIFPENVASISLHQLGGFRLVGLRQRVGKRDGVWRDTLLLERRSTIVGLD